MEKMVVDNKLVKVYELNGVYYVKGQGSIGNKQVIRIVELNGETKSFGKYAILNTDTNTIEEGRYFNLITKIIDEERVFRVVDERKKVTLFDEDWAEIDLNLLDQREFYWNKKEITNEDDDMIKLPFEVKTEDINTIQRGKVTITFPTMKDKEGNKVESFKSTRSLIRANVDLNGKVIKGYIRAYDYIKLNTLDTFVLIRGIVKKDSKVNYEGVGPMINLNTATVTKNYISETSARRFGKISGGYKAVQAYINPEFSQKISDYKGTITLPQCVKDCKTLGVYVNKNSEYLKTPKGDVVPCIDCAPFNRGVGAILMKDNIIGFIKKDGSLLGKYRIEQNPRQKRRDNRGIETQTNEIFELIQMGKYIPVMMDKKRYLVDISDVYNITNLERVKPVEVKAESSNIIN